MSQARKLSKAMVCLRARAALASLVGLLFSLLLAFPASGDGPRGLPLLDQGTTLADSLHLNWVREVPVPRPAWPDQPQMPFDAAPRPVVLGNSLFLPSTVTDSLSAYDIQTGEQKWQFRTDGPVRLAPAVWQQRLFLASDDGYLYCLEADKGQLLWKFRGGPSDRKILGNERLISTWPARGGPVVADGIVYFAAGIWPFMGIFLHALDARTGQVVWSNDGDGSLFLRQPHQAGSFASVAPQGTLVVSGDRLLVPGGRSVPACYDRRTGRMMYFRLGDNSKRGGGSEVASGDRFFLNGNAVYDLETGDYLGPVGQPALLTGPLLIGCSGSQLRVFDWSQFQSSKIQNPKSKIQIPKSIPFASATVPPLEVLIRAGRRLFAGAVNRVLAIDLPQRIGPARVTWQAPLEGHPVHLLAQEGRLFVSTREGRLYCFGPSANENRVGKFEIQNSPLAPQSSSLARQILATTGVREGYCIAWGAGTGQLIHALAQQSHLRIIVVEEDPARVEALRHNLEAAGLYGERVSVLKADPDTVDLPPYLASLMVSESFETAGFQSPETFARKVCSSLRPFGGVLCLALRPHQHSALETAIGSLPSSGQFHVREAGPWTLVAREGALPGSADWTHEHADPANTRVSQDQLAKAPLALLWFGGPSNQGVLPRHGHGPQPQVLGGRIIIEGPDTIRAVDIYTGRLLWETSLPGLGKAFDNKTHQPGANASGSNFVSTTDGIYVGYGESCLCLEPSTGALRTEFPAPALPGAAGPLTWDYVNVYEDFLIGGFNARPPDTRKSFLAPSSSRFLAVLDRHRGRLLWSTTAWNSFRHNAICLGGGRLFAIDRPATDNRGSLLYRASPGLGRRRLVALDVRTGKGLWQLPTEVFGTWLGYSVSEDILLESGRVTRDALADEPRGLRAWHGANGSVLWYSKDRTGPPLIHGKMLIQDGKACDLRSGAPILRVDPLTGKKVEWTWSRTYGCNTPAGSEHLLTFRSGAAGYYDLAHDGGTGNWGGFRSGCTNNLIVAGGLVTAPDYTRTCTCAYQNQTSLALVPVPEGEMWTFFSRQEVKGPIRQVGLNLGAPGCRKAGNGTLWLEYPFGGAPSRRIPVRVEGKEIEWFRRHETQVEGEALHWVAASGAEGLRSVTLTLGNEDRKAQPYTVRLYFFEPENLRVGQRVFSVALQGKTVLEHFDVSREAGGPGRSLVREFRGVKVGRDLTMALSPEGGGGNRGPVLSGIEVVAEGW